MADPKAAMVRKPNTNFLRWSDQDFVCIVTAVKGEAKRPSSLKMTASQMIVTKELPWVVVDCLTISHHILRVGSVLAPLHRAGKSGADLELRTMTRYRLDLPVTFRWQDHEGRQRVGAGFTHNVSAVGMFVFSDDVPEPDELVRCEVKLPRLRDSGCVPVMVAGRVVRVGSGPDWRQRGFAVVGHMLQLCHDLSSDDLEVSDLLTTPVKRFN